MLTTRFWHHRPTPRALFQRNQYHFWPSRPQWWMNPTICDLDILEFIIMKRFWKCEAIEARLWYCFDPPRLPPITNNMYKLQKNLGLIKAWIHGWTKFDLCILYFFASKACFLDIIRILKLRLLFMMRSNGYNIWFIIIVSCAMSSKNSLPNVRH